MNATMLRRLSLLTFAGAALSAQGAIVSFGASGLLETNPANMKYGPNPYGNNFLHLWNERQGYVLTSGLVVDAVADGVYTNTAQLGTFTLAAGTRLDSHYIAYDPVSNSQTGSITFSGRIIGIIVTSEVGGDRLFTSDYLRLASVPNANVPGAHYGLRGLELNPDAFTINGNTLTVRLSASTPGDGIRVLTASPVPGPAALGPFALGALATRRKRRRA